MKQILLAAILSALVASGVTLLVAGPARVPAPPAAPDPAVAELRAALDATRKELAELRQRAGAAGPDSAGGSPLSAVEYVQRHGGTDVPGAVAGTKVAGAEAQPRGAGAVEEAEEPAQESDEDRLNREFAARRPAAQVERIRDAAVWDSNPDTRARWILTPEAEVLAAFGKPDNIWVQQDGTECWTYGVPSAERDENGNLTLDDITLLLNRGRLVRVDD
jgi:hypothetical protein